MKSRAAMIADIIDDLRRIFQGLTERSRRIERESGLSPSQLMIVKILEDAGPMKVSDLAKRMYLHPATMVGVLDRLEAKGLVVRTKSAEDRRVVHICITDRGRELLQNSPEVEQGLFLKKLESLPLQQLETTHKGMKQMVSTLGCEEVPPQLIMSSEINSPKRRRKTAKI